MVANKKTKIIEFPSKLGTSPPPVFQDDIENLNDYEGYEESPDQFTISITILSLKGI